VLWSAPPRELREGDRIDRKVESSRRKHREKRRNELAAKAEGVRRAGNTRPTGQPTPLPVIGPACYLRLDSYEVLVLRPGGFKSGRDAGGRELTAGPRRPRCLARPCPVTATSLGRPRSGHKLSNAGADLDPHDGEGDHQVLNGQAVNGEPIGSTGRTSSASMKASSRSRARRPAVLSVLTSGQYRVLAASIEMTARTPSERPTTRSRRDRAQLLPEPLGTTKTQPKLVQRRPTGTAHGEAER